MHHNECGSYFSRQHNINRHDTRVHVGIYWGNTQRAQYYHSYYFYILMCAYFRHSFLYVPALLQSAASTEKTLAIVGYMHYSSYAQEPTTLYHCLLPIRLDPGSHYGSNLRHYCLRRRHISPLRTQFLPAAGHFQRVPVHR